MLYSDANFVFWPMFQLYDHMGIKSKQNISPWVWSLLGAYVPAYVASRLVEQDIVVCLFVLFLVLPVCYLIGGRRVHYSS